MKPNDNLILKNRDSALKGVSLLLIHDDENPTFRKELLNEDLLDYSLESLSEIEKYIKKTSLEYGFYKKYNTTVLRLGAYLGQVIKQVQNSDFHWYDYETISEEFKTLKSYGNKFETAAILYSLKSNNIYLPIAKIINFIEDSKNTSLINYAKKAELTMISKPFLKFKKYLELHRNYYVFELAKIAQHEKSFTPEIMVDINTEHTDEIFRLYRFDFIKQKENGNSVSELNLEETINHKKIELQIEGVHIELYPLLWNALEIKTDNLNLNLDSYKKWISKWIDKEDKKTKDKNGLKRVIHHALPPENDGNNIKLNIDLGSVNHEAVIELLELLTTPTCSFIKIGSFEMMQYDE